MVHQQVCLLNHIFVIQILLFDITSGLITKQEDTFDIPGWDIVLSALFPFLIGWVTKAPAPEVEPRVISMPPGVEMKKPQKTKPLVDIQSQVVR